MIPPKRTTPPPNQNSTRNVSFAPIPSKKGQRVLLYGTGGIGKTTLACQAPGRVAFIDLDESLPILSGQLEAAQIEMPLYIPGPDWQTIRTALQSSGWDDVSTIVVDTATKLEEMAVAQTLRMVKNDAGHTVSSVEGYGYGKGFQFVFDQFLPILGDLDRHVRAGRNVILIAHECTANVPNPSGEDWIRYEPRLQNPTSGKASIRARLKEWCDHVLFLGYDVNVDKKSGVAQGSGTRTLSTAEMPSFMAKSRTTSESFDIVPGVDVWPSIIK